MRLPALLSCAALAGCVQASRETQRVVGAALDARLDSLMAPGVTSVTRLPLTVVCHSRSGGGTTVTSRCPFVGSGEGAMDVRSSRGSSSMPRWPRGYASG